MEDFPQKLHEQQLKESALQITNMFVRAAERCLAEDDPLRSRIIDYYTRPETKRALFTYLGKLGKEENSLYKQNVKHFTENPLRFIEEMEKRYELEDTHGRRRELASCDRLATDEEYRLGAYVDVLESQVRDAVLAAQRKGYRTFQSGFKEKNERDQFMDFYNKHLTIPENALSYARARSIEIKVEPFNDRATLTLHPVGDDAIRLAQWKEIWDTFIDLLPPANPEMLSNVRTTGEHAGFRQKQDAFKKQTGLREKIAAVLRRFK